MQPHTPCCHVKEDTAYSRVAAHSNIIELSWPQRRVLRWTFAVAYSQTGVSEACSLLPLLTRSLQ